MKSSQFQKFLLLVGCISSTLFSTTQQDILTLTGNIPAKAVWVRAAQSASDFTSSPSCLYNAGVATTLVCFGTSETAIRTLDATVAQHVSPIITRSGDYVIWSDVKNTKSIIIKWDGSGKKDLISTGNYFVLSCQWDDVAKKEYLYTTDAAGTPATKIEEPFYKVIYKIEFLNGSVVGSGTKVFDQSGSTDPFRAPMLVSGDGKLGGMNNWPYMFVYNFSSKAGTSMSGVTGDNLSCWPNMAPDTSYRFFHFNEAHNSLHMFDRYDVLASNSAKVRLISIASKLPGNTYKDANGPRFSNSSKFISISYPLQGDGTYKAGEFCIGKFNDSFTDATFVRVSDNTDAFRDRIGDMWIANGEGPNKSTALAAQAKPISSQPIISIHKRSGYYSISLSGELFISAMVTDLAGHTLTTTGAKNQWNIPMNKLHTGAYIFKARSGNRQVCTSLLICK